jgi:hypothetical protein
MLQPPVGHSFEHRLEAFSQRTKAIFHVWGDDRFGLAADEAVSFELAQLLDQHLPGR